MSIPSESSESLYHYLRLSGETGPPRSWEIISNLHSEGLIKDDLIRSEGTEEWVKFRDVKRQRRRMSQLPPPTTESISEELVHARILGLRGQVTFADIKRHYRERMMEYHPDKVAPLGPKLRELAEQETKKINEAYEFFSARYTSGRNT